MVVVFESGDALYQSQGVASAGCQSAEVPVLGPRAHFMYPPRPHCAPHELRIHQ